MESQLVTLPAKVIALILSFEPRLDHKLVSKWVYQLKKSRPFDYLNWLFREDRIKGRFGNFLNCNINCYYIDNNMVTQPIFESIEITFDSTHFLWDPKYACKIFSTEAMIMPNLCDRISTLYIKVGKGMVRFRAYTGYSYSNPRYQKVVIDAFEQLLKPIKDRLSNH